MKTPDKYKLQLERKRLSAKLIGDVLYSLSSRAKNAADKERQYLNSKPDYSLDNRLRKREYWGMLKNILTYGGFYPKEIYYVDRYSESNCACDKGCVAYSEYLEKLKLATDPLFCVNPCTASCPDRHVRKQFLRTDYYLHFRVGNHSFVTLNSEKGVEKYKHLPWTKLDEVFFDGAEIEKLLSVQFCRKVHECFVATNENIY